MVPALMASVAKLVPAVSPSMSLSLLSSVRPFTFCVAITDDGVRTLVIVNSCAVAWISLVPAVVKVSLRRLVVSTVTTVPASVFGVVNSMAGTSVVPVLAAPALFSNDHVSWGSSAPSASLAGSTSSILPPISTRPAVVKPTVTTEAKPGVSVAVAKLVAVSAPAAI